MAAAVANLDRSRGVAVIHSPLVPANKADESRHHGVHLLEANDATRQTPGCKRTERQALGPAIGKPTVSCARSKCEKRPHLNSWRAARDAIRSK